MKNSVSFRHRNLFFKLIASFLMVTLVPLLAFYFQLGKTINSIHPKLEKIAINLGNQKTSSDLKTATMAFNLWQNQLKSHLETLAANPNLRQAIVQRDRETLNTFLSTTAGEDSFHFLHLLDTDGSQIAALLESGPDAPNFNRHPFVVRALGRNVVLGIINEPDYRLDMLGLLNEATIPVLSARYRYPVDFTFLTDGMAIEVAVPVFSDQGQMIGVLHGGHVLNRSRTIVDYLYRICFDDVQTGHVSIFSGPVCVSTTMMTPDRQPAFGRLIPQSIGTGVLDEDQTVQAELNLVDDVYLSACQPLHDYEANVVGAVCVGTDRDAYIQAHFEQGQRIADELWQTFTIKVIISLLLSLVVAIFLAHRITRPIRQMMQQTVSIATGNLKSRLKIHQRDEIGQLAHSINEMTNSLQYLVSQTRAAARKVKDYAHRISEAIHALATATNQQSAAVNQTTATMEEVAASSRQIAESSNFVAETAVTTQENARKGVDAIRDTLRQMNEIWKRNERSIGEIINLGHKSREIGEVMEIINSIADQTKLIAFNAAIESSGDSEAEKRFSIVAAEVRRLADNVMQSTEEIRLKIEEIQEATYELVISSEEGTKKLRNGLEHTQVTAHSLEEILEAANMTAESARQISLATQQQKTASEQVVAALQEIFDGTKQVVETNNGSITISDQLQTLSDELQMIIEKFQTE